MSDEGIKAICEAVVSVVVMVGLFVFWYRLLRDC